MKRCGVSGICVVLSSFFVISCANGSPAAFSSPSTNAAQSAAQLVSRNSHDAPPASSQTAAGANSAQTGSGPKPQSQEPPAVPKNPGSHNNTKTGNPPSQEASQGVVQEFSRTSSTVNYWNSPPVRVESGKTVVITFDDGPSPWTDQLIHTLDQHRVPAVFFWNTYHLSFANENVVQLLKESPTIQVGDHTVDHPNLLGLGFKQQAAEILDAKAAIELRTGQPVYFFRPPYGNYNRTTEAILNANHLCAVMWNDDSKDWYYNRNETAILNQVRSELKPGAILLFHDHKDTIAFLPDILAMIQREGYSFTTLATPNTYESQG